MGAEFVRGRVCQGPSLLGAEMSRNHWKIMTRLKNKDGCCQLGFSVFHKNYKSVSVKIMTGLSPSILSAEKSQSIQHPTFSSCGTHIRSGDKIFLFKLQRQQCACNGPLESLLITRKMHLYRHLSRFLGRLLDFSSV